MTMSYDQAVIHLRSQIKQLSAAAASQCLRDRLERSSLDHPLVELDLIARQLAAPAFEALSVLTGEAQAWPDALDPTEAKAAAAHKRNQRRKGRR
jgi:hypothetical protein